MNYNAIRAVISNLTKVRVVLGTVNIEAKNAGDIVAIDNALTESIAMLDSELKDAEKMTEASES